MAISYKPLWHLLVEKEMDKENLKRAANMTINIVLRMSKKLLCELKVIRKDLLGIGLQN